MSLKNSILSLFGNALGLAKFGADEETKQRWQNTLDRLREEHPTIDAEYKERFSDKLGELRDKLGGGSPEREG